MPESDASKPHSTHKITEIGHGFVLDEPVNLGSLNWVNAAVAELRRLYDLEEQLEAAQRQAFAGAEALQWVAATYPKVIDRMPRALFRALREADAQVQS